MVATQLYAISVHLNQVVQVQQVKVIVADQLMMDYCYLQLAAAVAVLEQ